MTVPKYGVGTPGCYCIGSDTYPVTLIRQSKTGKTILVQFDQFIGDVENGHDYFGNQVWKFVRNTSGRIQRFDWSEKYQKFSQGGVGSVYLGKWAARQDPSF
jgi:hypothetical protein